jgi:hypothetical protein
MKPAATFVSGSAPPPQVLLWKSGRLADLTAPQASSKRGPPRQGVQRAPTAAHNWRYEQRRHRSPLRHGRVAATQCWHRGREAGVAGGVTTTQGHGQRRGRAKGLRPDQFHNPQTRLALGRIMESP